MRRTTNVVLVHKRITVLVWLVLAAAGLATVSTTTSKLTGSFALPGQPGYETNARIERMYHNGGLQEPTIATITLPAGKTTTSPADAARIARIFSEAASAAGRLRVLDAATAGGAGFSTEDHRTAYAVMFVPVTGGPGQADLTPPITRRLKSSAPAGWATGVTGIDPLTNASSSGAGLIVEILLGAVGALLVLAFVFASFLAVVPLLMAAAAIPTTFLLVLGLTTVTSVSMVVQFLIGLIGLGVAIDYSLLVVTRWRELRASGESNDDAVRHAMATAGRSVILSGTTVAISLLALAVLPVPYLRSVGLAGFFIPLTSIAVAITLLPVLLSSIGPRLDFPRIRHEASASGPWTAWARLIVRHRGVSAVLGVAVVAVLIVPFLGLRDRLTDQRIAGPLRQRAHRADPTHLRKGTQRDHHPDRGPRPGRPSRGNSAAARRRPRCSARPRPGQPNVSA